MWWATLQFPKHPPKHAFSSWLSAFSYSSGLPQNTMKTSESTLDGPLGPSRQDLNSEGLGMTGDSPDLRVL